MNEQIKAIVEVAIRDNGVVDDHTGEFENFSKDHITGIGMINLHKNVVCEDDSWKCFPMFDYSNGYSINGMYLGSDGHAHISRWSIDNVLYPMRDENHGFDAYNEEIRDAHKKGFLKMTKEKEFKVLYSAI